MENSVGSSPSKPADYKSAIQQIENLRYAASGGVSYEAWSVA
jgi:hypothetical protein